MFCNAGRIIRCYDTKNQQLAYVIAIFLTACLSVVIPGVKENFYAKISWNIAAFLEIWNNLSLRVNCFRCFYCFKLSKSQSFLFYNKSMHAFGRTMSVDSPNTSLTVWQNINKLSVPAVIDNIDIYSTLFFLFLKFSELYRSNSFQWHIGFLKAYNPTKRRCLTGSEYQAWEKSVRSIDNTWGGDVP